MERDRTHNAHARQFPTGQLAEECESLAIRALGQLGDRANAEQRAATFRQRFPDSLLLDCIEEALK